MWSKIDSNFYSHPKVLGAGLTAIGAWVRMLSWSSHFLTNGVVPEKWALILSDDSNHALQRLVEVNMLERTPDGYYIHDYPEYNPDTTEKKQARHEAAVKRGQASSAARKLRAGANS